MDERTGTVGQRVRRLRTRQGMSLATLAILSGLSKGYLSKVENDISNLDRRRSLHAVADALDVPMAVILGQPYDPETRQGHTVKAAVGDVQDALYGSEVGERYEPPRDDLVTLRRTTDRILALSNDNAFAAFGPLLPDTLADLHAFTADPDGAVREEALRTLVDALDATQWLAKCMGETDLAWLAAERALLAARHTEDQVVIGFAQFLRSQSLLRTRRARQRAGRVAAGAAEVLQSAVGDGGPAAEVYGSLHLTAAWVCTVDGRHADAEDQVAEAAEVAERTGNGHAYRLWFGPNNLAVWRMSMAVERQEGGRVVELARGAIPADLPSKGRRAGYWIELGRGLADAPGQRDGAVRALQRAERLAPMRTRMDPYVRMTVRELLYDSGGRDLRQMARRMGLIPG